MHPILLKLGPVTLYSYGAMLVVAFLVSTWLAVQAARRLPAELRAITPQQLLDFTSVALFGGLVGARALYVLLSWGEFAEAPLRIVALWEGGLIWYGGFAGGVAAAWLYVRAQRLSFLRVLDQFIPFLALGHAIGRIGCFLNGCCYGKGNIPTQALESLGLVVVFVLLRLAQPNGLRRPGRLFGGYLVLYGVLRFGVEFLRGDQPVWWAGLTLQQLISLGMMLLGVLLSFRVSRFKFHVTDRGRET